MSVLIKGMDMPKAGELLQVAENVDGKIFVRETTHGEWHPLIEVTTPHGRLIDADYLLAMAEEYIEEYDATDSYGLHTDKWCGWKEAEDVIRTAKTVIEAED